MNQARWLREPLVHFVALGSVVFGLRRWVAPPPLTHRIVLSESVIRGLRQDYLRRNGALPTPEEETVFQLGMQSVPPERRSGVE